MKSARAAVPVEAPAASRQAIEPAPSLGRFGIVNLMRLLMDKASPALASADLQAIVTSGALFVEQSSQHAADVAEGLGCLVAEDDATGVGSFQSGKDVAGLVFHMASHFQALAGVSAAVGMAADELALRSEK